MQIGGAGFANLAKGYLSYAQEILVNRAFPDLYDGLKPVQRFILYVLHNQKNKGYNKSNPVKAEVLRYHPHGDASVYEAMARMTDNNGTFMIPLIDGQGNFGTYFSKKSPAADRYTEVKEISYAEEFFSMLNGVPYDKTEDGRLDYPRVLPLTFPMVLANESNGMGVGFATRIPSFNLTDLAGLIEEYLTTGKMETIIAPDFSSKGYIVNNQAEFDKIMHVGKGRLKLRSRVEIEGKEIIVRELPYGVTVEKLASEISDLEIPNLMYADNMSGRANGLEFVITCRSAATVDQVLLELYKRTSLQCNYTSNMVFIEKGKPVQTGVYGVIERWVDWRKGVIQLEANTGLMSLNAKLANVEAFLRLLQDAPLRDKVVHTVTKVSVEEARKLLISSLKIADSVATWILNRRLSQFNSSTTKYQAQYDKLIEEKGVLEDIFNYPEKVIMQDMTRIKRNPILGQARRTEITNKDFLFVDKKKDEELVDKSPCYYYIEQGFIKKFAVKPSSVPENVALLEGLANDVIISIDEEGCIYRTYGEELGYTSMTDLGTYIPRYAGVEEANFIWHAVAKAGDKKLLIYNDGYAGYLDLTPFARENVNQRSRFMQNGINKAVDQLLDIIDYNEEDYLVVEDWYTRNPKLGVIQIKDIEEKARTSRTKIMNAKQTTKFSLFTKEELESQIDIEDFLVTKEKRKMEVYNGDYPIKMEEQDDSGEEVSYAEAQALYDQVVQG